MTAELQKKVDRAVKLIQQAGRNAIPEVAYSGGKDSDVILELARMSGIEFRAIYRNTTIDPPGTIAHVKANGVEIIRPKQTFFQLIERHGFPNRLTRFCCKYMKEYKVLDRCIMGVRRAESTKRAARYSEPTECRFYGSKKNHVEAFYPILEWSNQDVADFIEARGIKCHPLYYVGGGNSMLRGVWGVCAVRWPISQRELSSSRSTLTWSRLIFGQGRSSAIPILIQRALKCIETLMNGLYVMCSTQTYRRNGKN
jgi:3'-phosphoadenosine 5'-phosphosulfate sulfotransferase (PAPS reductase)/FAD synthetase